MSLNKIILIGHVGKDPERRGSAIQFSLATNDRYTTKDGEKRDETTWHNIAVFGKSADTVEKYVKKGDKLYVEGKQSYSKYTDKEGVERTGASVLCSQWQFVGSKKESDTGTNMPVTQDDDIPF